MNLMKEGEKRELEYMYACIIPYKVLKKTNRKKPLLPESLLFLPAVLLPYLKMAATPSMCLE